MQQKGLKAKKASTLATLVCSRYNVTLKRSYLPEYVSDRHET